MPLVKIQVSEAVADERRGELLAAVSRTVAEATGKPETYMMVSLDDGAFYMGGDAGAAAYVDLRAIGGLEAATNAELTRRLCDVLGRELNIPAARVYITFTDVAASHWGWDGKTFG